MTIHLFASGNRAATITTVGVIAVTALLLPAATPARAANGAPLPVLAQGAGMGAMPSAQVRVVQRALQRRGYDLGPSGVDGRFGPRTETAVRQMQADHGLAVDGIVGQETRKTLRRMRHAVAPTRLWLHKADPGSKAATLVPARQTAIGAGSREAVVAPGHRAARWSDSFLAWALGALIAYLLVIAVLITRRRRDRMYATSSPPARPIGRQTANRSNGKAVRIYALQSVNSKGEGPPPTRAAVREPPSRLPGARARRL
jgi:peptidoglycan hydrolase-like protein with peptidoglycan-binding domain